MADRPVPDRTGGLGRKSMEMLYLGVVFAVIVLLLAMKRPLYLAMLGGLLATALLYRLSPGVILSASSRVFTDWNSFQVLLSLYLITYLQRMLESRHMIKLAQQDLNGLFHNRRVNAGGAPVFIGLLPSAAAMILCADIVKDSTEGYLEPKEQAFLTSWMRHIPESILPTYSGVLIMTSISQVPLPKFMLGMLVPTLVLAALGYFPYLRRLPRDPGTAPSVNRAGDLIKLMLHLWPLLLIIALILVFNISVVPASLVAMAAMALLCRFSLRELGGFVISAFELKLILNTFLVLVLKEFIGCTGVLERMPETLSVLPVPMYLIFALLFFLGGIISGASGIIALGTPLAFAAMDGGMPLMVLLMCMSHAASQVSPVHVCLVVAADYYKVSLGELIRKSIVPSLLFCVMMLGYYQILLAIC